MSKTKLPIGNTSKLEEEIIKNHEKLMTSCFVWTYETNPNKLSISDKINLFAKEKVGKEQPHPNPLLIDADEITSPKIIIENEGPPPDNYSTENKDSPKDGNQPDINNSNSIDLSNDSEDEIEIIKNIALKNQSNKSKSFDPLGESDGISDGDDDIDFLINNVKVDQNILSKINDLEERSIVITHTIKSRLQCNINDPEIPILKSQRRDLWEQIEMLESKIQYPQNRSVSTEEFDSFKAIDEGDEIFEVFPAEQSNIDPQLLQDISLINQNVFHHSKFRGVQAAAIDQALKGKDVFVLMPTGGGKSLVYQLTGYIQKGLTVIISPLISLIQDQVRSLNELNNPELRAAALLGNLSQREQDSIIDMVRQLKFRFLFITPEKLSLSANVLNFLLEMHAQKQITRFVVDEAHCVSQWGYDFRPTYAQLDIIRTRFTDVPILALTATATKAVRMDVIDKLMIPNCSVFQMSFNRPNLYYEVCEKGSKIESFNQILSFIKEHHFEDKCGLIFCMATLETENLSSWLNSHGLKTAFYHAQMRDEQKKHEVQKKWMRNEIHIIVATLAFGMGIDKPDVRFVIHHTMPKSIEEYYQESGRAGRDGKRSYCMLLFKLSDKQRVKKLISLDNEKGEKNELRMQIELQLLDSMGNYCMERNKCRRCMLLNYFGEVFDPEQCNETCDNCARKESGLSKFVQTDFTNVAVDIANIIHAITLNRPDKAPYPTVNHVILVYTGHSRASIDSGIPEFKKGYGYRNTDNVALHKIFPILVDNKVIKNRLMKSMHGTIQYYATDVNYENFIKNKTPKILIDCETFTIPSGMTQLDTELYRSLIKLRQNLASDQNSPPSTVLSSNILKKLAIDKPKNLSELVNIGFSTYKIIKYGNYFLEAINKFVVAHAPPPPPPPPPPPNVTPSKEMQEEIKRKIMNEILLQHLKYQYAQQTRQIRPPLQMRQQINNNIPMQQQMTQNYNKVSSPTKARKSIYPQQPLQSPAVQFLMSNPQILKQQQDITQQAFQQKMLQLSTGANLTSTQQNYHPTPPVAQQQRVQPVPQQQQRVPNPQQQQKIQLIPQQMQQIAQPVPQQMQQIAQHVPQQMQQIAQPVPQQMQQIAQPVPQQMQQIAQPVPQQQKVELTWGSLQSQSPIAQKIPQKFQPQQQMAQSVQSQLSEPVSDLSSALQQKLQNLAIDKPNPQQTTPANQNNVNVSSLNQSQLQFFQNLKNYMQKN
ncbi:ATP-dependent DNA helicase, RecQ family protein [Histomonas meleagridis]|uniref:ATP-dependent DNA helicase, RecQ family protein n=1 Tax=Histomonas meleagridis TaxID=135588 RepID=UPI00355A9E14|nr:ATP-dependent DNA helicase, RecQ family protein [Histomonas meleagridis]KAH0803795.1 ATP-dependent DNA helicase, RecQ family protein [Histomonas meleagridis]